VYNIYLFNIILYFKLLPYIDIPKPHKFATQPLKAEVEILNIIIELGKLLPQIAEFIARFTNEIRIQDINVITDVSGNLAIEVPDTMTKAQGTLVSARISILDRLIHTQLDKSEALIFEAIRIEEELINKDPNYETKLTNIVSEFRRLKSSYRH
jgi:hypothetical protein